MKHILLLSIAALLTIAGCKSTKPGTAAVALPVQDTVTNESFRKLMRDKDLYNAVKETVPVDTAYLVRDTLHVLTKRILGCDAENFKLFWNGATAKSLPPQVTVKLFQQVDAGCKERHYFHLTYNVKSLKLSNSNTAPATDSAALSATILHIGGYKNPVRYGY
ncbi:MAG TPA: hypothetical protein VK154_05960 [Chitinophagales bacterium]|nr:hypothetical protein [Chitinophagales bacterium]